MATFPGDMHIGWGFGLEHCTGSPTCQCSDCRLTEHNANEAPEDQLPHGYKYESPVTEASRAVGLYDFRDEPECDPEGYQPTDPLLAVSELEQRVIHLENETLSDDTVTQLEGRVEYVERYERTLTNRISKLESQLLIEQSHSQEQLMRITNLEKRMDVLLHRSSLYELYDNRINFVEQRITDLEERLRSLVFVVNIVCSSMHDVMHDEGRIDGHRTLIVELIKRTEILARQADIFFTDDLNKKELGETEQ